MLACVAFYDGKGGVEEAQWFKTDDAAMQDYAANRHKCAQIPTTLLLYSFCFDSSVTPSSTPCPQISRHLTNAALRMVNLSPGEKRSDYAADFAAAVRCNPCLTRRSMTKCNILRRLLQLTRTLRATRRP